MVSRNQNIAEKITCGFTSALSSAVSEWFLILLLYLNGLFSYLVTKFADYCKLQTPCLFCSRLDHILGSEKPGFYKKLLCHSHKLEISSSSYCHIHRTIADVSEMCESCMLSFATEKTTSSAAHRSLLAKLEIKKRNSESNAERSPETKKDNRFQSKSKEKDNVHVPLLSDASLGFLRTRHCSCCNAQFRMKSHAHRLLQAKSVVPDVAEPTGAILGLNGHTFQQPQVGLNTRKEIHRKSNASLEGNQGSDRLSHVGYTELKITSDTESEIPASDDDDRSSLPQISSDVKGKLPQNPVPNVSMSGSVTSKSLSGEVQEEKFIHTAPTVTAAMDAVQDKQVSSNEPSRTASASKSGPAHGSGEINLNEAQEPPCPTQPDSESHVVPLEGTDAMKTADVRCISSSANDEEPKVLQAADTSSKTLQVNSDPVLSIPSIMDLNDAYKLVLSGKTFDPSPSPRSSVRANEDLRQLLSHISATQGLELPWNDMTCSPRVSGTAEDFKFLDGSGGLHSLAKKISIERNESGFDSSLDGSIFGEVEGENAIERLKKQVELERKTLLLLYKELEEERSASAIAANQAMAMITRLQEEKAAMQMEALQYQRMMEEQAEYDQEVMQKANDLLAQRERELQELEAEIIAYRRRFLDEYKDKEMPPLDATDEREANHNSNLTDAEGFGFGEKTHVKRGSLLSFEDEKRYIFSCLKRLENKLHSAHNNGVFRDMHKLNGDQMKLDNATENGQLYDTDKIQERNMDEVPESSHIKGHASSVQRSQYHAKEYPLSKSRRMIRSTSMRTHNERLSHAYSNADKRHRLATGVDNDAADIETELSLLNERLEALEADRSFLEHTISSLKNGDQGLHFVQEIASHLQELRKALLGRTEQLAT